MPKIMVVEDDQNLREIYSIRLTAEGYEVDEDLGSNDKFHGRVVTFIGNGLTFKLQRLWGSDEKRQTFTIFIPIRSE